MVTLNNKNSITFLDQVETIENEPTVDEMVVLSLRNKGLSKMFQASTDEGVPNQLRFFSKKMSLSVLVKLDLSYNCLECLPPFEVLKEFTGLRMLFLNHNLLSRWSDLESVSAIQSLLHLTMNNNPVYLVAGYRNYLVNSIKELRALDDFVITDEERMDGICNGVRFRSLSPFMRLYIPQFQEGLTWEQQAIQVELEMYKLKRLFEKNSPATRIQALWKGYQIRVFQQNYFQKRTESIIKIQKVVRGHQLRASLKKELRFLMKIQGLEYLVMSNDELREYNARQVIAKPFKKYLARVRLKKLRNRMAVKIQTQIRAFLSRKFSYLKGLNYAKYPVVYFSKEQTLKVKQLLAEVQEKLYGEAKDDFSDIYLDKDCEFYTYRYPDSQEFKYYNIPLLHMTMPSLKCKVEVRNEEKLLQKNHLSLKYKVCKFGDLNKKENRQKAIQRFEKIKVQPRGFDLTKIQQVVQRRARHFDLYDDFITFRSPSEEFTRTLLKKIMIYNYEHQKEQVIPYFKYPLLLVDAALKIQAGFRFYLWRRDDRKEDMVQKLIQRRAASCIQSWWKRRKLRITFKFYDRLRSYLRAIDDPVLYLEEQMYLALEQIVRDKKRNVMKLWVQKIVFSFDRDTRNVHAFNIKIGRLFSSLIPNWVAPISDQEKSFDQENQVFKNNLQALLHFTHKDHFTSICDYNNIVNYKEKSIDLKYGLNFVRMVNSSVEEARMRALIVALLTFYVRKEIFFTFYTKRQMEEGFFLTHIRDQWYLFDIDLSNVKKKLRTYPEHDKANNELKEPAIIIRKNHFQNLEPIQGINKKCIQTIVAGRKQFYCIEDREPRQIQIQPRLPELEKTTSQLVVHSTKNQGTIINIGSISNNSSKSSFRQGRHIQPFQMNNTSGANSLFYENPGREYNLSCQNRTLSDRKTLADKLKQINKSFEQSKRQEIEEQRVFRRDQKRMSVEQQIDQYKQYSQYKEEQKELVTGLLNKGKEREQVDKLSKKVKVLQMNQESKKKKEDLEFSKSICAQISMVAKMANDGNRMKHAKQEADKQKSIKSSFLIKKQSAQPSLGKVDLYDSFLMKQFDNLHQQSTKVDHSQLSPMGKRKFAFPRSGRSSPREESTQFSGSQRMLADSKYSSMIRVYERENENKRYNHQQSKDVIVLNESFQLPPFPGKSTRNQFEKRYQQQLSKKKQELEQEESIFDNQNHYTLFNTSRLQRSDDQNQ